jgi:hypothetical protein
LKYFSFFPNSILSILKDLWVLSFVKPLLIVSYWTHLTCCEYFCKVQIK